MQISVWVVAHLHPPRWPFFFWRFLSGGAEMLNIVIMELWLKEIPNKRAGAKIFLFTFTNPSRQYWFPVMNVYGRQCLTKH